MDNALPFINCETSVIGKRVVDIEIHWAREGESDLAHKHL